MPKTLEMIFVSDIGKNITVSVDDPKEPVDLDAVKGVMDIIIAQQAFSTQSGKPYSKKCVRVVERNVDEYEV
ncbi:DUF2922 domain-containing protein [Peribacillus tepidiphilus]|uniref:DUF2922 domain-containing protein n=1 Tax=Peribacillus tepidiphilus TaxID=2652445 RepID=UPI001292883A|nr:DUF2922 domain-containing protein [Peribacillus tepidiphilus]